VTFAFRSKDASSYFMAMDATGTMSGEAWLSKTVTAKFYSVSSARLDVFTIAQNSDYLDITGAMDSSTIGTVDGSDFRFVSRAQLLGSNAKTYALGDGSSKMQLGAGSGATNNWNGDSGVHGAGPTTYDADVASATLPSMTAVYATDFTTDEAWDCQTSGTVYNFATLMSSNATLLSDMIACSEDFQ
jgi:hypothetical protein